MAAEVQKSINETQRLSWTCVPLHSGSRGRGEMTVVSICYCHLSWLQAHARSTG